MSAISVSWLNVSWGAVYIETNYGLMQHSYIEIKNKLLGALDSEYNVVDMATVFEVVAVLEKTPITPEILETTRIGMLINQCRKRSNNETLAKRAKNLLRTWRNMIAQPVTNRSAPTAPRVLSPAAAPSNVIPPSASSSAVLQLNGTTTLQRSSERIATPSISPALSAPESVGRYDGTVSPSSSLSPGCDPKVESVPKTHVANKRLRKASPPAAGEPPTKAGKLNGAMFVEKHDSPPEDYSRLRDQPAITVDDEEQSTGQTVVTESVPEPDPPLPKKRSRKKANKKKVSEEDIVKEKLVAMSKAVRLKTTEELVAGLKSRADDRLQASTSDTSLDYKSVKPSLSNNIHSTENLSAAAGSGSKGETNEHLDPETRVEREIAQIMAKLPPLNVDEICWDSPQPSPPTSPKPITDEDIDRYLQQSWDGVNGCVTHLPSAINNATADKSEQQKSEFKEWHEMVSRRTFNDDLIHILPYSIVD